MCRFTRTNSLSYVTCHTHELITTIFEYRASTMRHVTQLQICRVTHELNITYDVSHSRTHYHICRVTLTNSSSHMSCHTHELIIIRTNVTVEKEKTPDLCLSGVTFHVTHMMCHTHELIITCDVSHFMSFYVTYMHQSCHKYL